MTDWIRQAELMATIHENVHESLYRAHAILKLVKHWCDKGVPSDVILDWIEHIEAVTPPPDQGAEKG